MKAEKHISLAFIVNYVKFIINLLSVGLKTSSLFLLFGLARNIIRLPFFVPRLDRFEIHFSSAGPFEKSLLICLPDPALWKKLLLISRLAIARGKQYSSFAGSCRVWTRARSDLSIDL